MQDNALFGQVTETVYSLHNADLVKQIEATVGIDYTSSKLQQLQHPLLERHDISLQVKRDDLLHPVVSGNKWRKLKYNLANALANGHEHIISMGGAWSNHLHALAYVGHRLNIKTTALVRGDEEHADSPTLQDLRDWGMQLRFVNRSDYRHLRSHRQHDAPPAEKLNGYWIPEGGASVLALKGIAEINQEIDADIDNLFVACGTGTALAGLITTGCHYQVTGVAVLRAESFMQADIEQLLGATRPNVNWSINHDYHCGGFARKDEALLAFIEQFEEHTGIPVEPVYTGKLFYAIFNLVETGKIKPGSRIMALHSGGLQGKRSAG